MTEIIHAASGKRRFELKRPWWERLFAPIIWVIVVVAFALTEEGPDLEAIAWLTGTLAFMGIASEVLWSVYNYVIVHPEHIDVSRWIWATKAKNRTKYRIPYGEISQASGAEETGDISIHFRVSSGFMRRLGVNNLSFEAVLREPSGVRQVLDAIELGRERASERATVLGP